MGIMASLSFLGTVNTVINNYPKALDYYQQSIRINEEVKNDLVTASNYVNIGVIYSELKKYDQALTYFQTGLDLNIKINNGLGIAGGLGNMGNAYFNSKNYEQAVEYFKKSLDKYVSVNNKLGIAMQYGNMASAFNELENYDEAFKNYTQSLEINEEIKNKKGIATNLHGIGEYYLKQSNYAKALEVTKKANALAASINVQDLQKGTFENLSKIYEKLGKMDSAFISYKKFIEIKDNIDNETNRKQISRLEIQYEFDTKETVYKNNQVLATEKLKQQQLLLALNQSKLSESNKERDLVRLTYLKTQSELQAEQLEKKIREKQLAVAEKEITLSKLIIETKEKQKWLYVGGIFLITVVCVLLHIQSINSKKINQKLQVLNTELDVKNTELDVKNTELEEANKTKIQFFSILNHDLRSPVSNLIDFLHLQKDSPEMLDDKIKNRIEKTTLVSAENLLTSMEDILLWSKSQMVNFKPKAVTVDVTLLFDDLKRHFSSEENIRIEFENIENIKLNTDENYLKTIIRNLTGNAIKALQAATNPAITWKAWRANNQSCLSITDNGPGAMQEDFKALYDDKEVVGIKTGLGLHLIRDLAKMINCKISVETNLGKGTTFVLLLPFAGDMTDQAS
jgi:signal transduction histidine kinase